MFRKMQEVEESRPSRRRGVEPITVSAAASSLRRAKALEGTRKSYLENLESMQRVHVDPSIGSMPLEKVSTEPIETLASGLLRSGRSPKTVRNLLTFLYSVFEYAIANGWCHENPVRRAARPKRRRAGDASPDLQFLTVPELEAVLRAIPDEAVHRAPAPTRRGRTIVTSPYAAAGSFALARDHAFRHRRHPRSGLVCWSAISSRGAGARHQPRSRLVRRCSGVAAPRSVEVGSASTRGPGCRWVSVDSFSGYGFNVRFRGISGVQFGWSRSSSPPATRRREFDRHLLPLPAARARSSAAAVTRPERQHHALLLCH